MTLEEVRHYCGGKWVNISRFFGFSANTYQGWVREGVIPIASQYKIEKMSHGQLVAKVEEDVKHEQRTDSD